MDEQNHFNSYHFFFPEKKQETIGEELQLRAKMILQKEKDFVEQLGLEYEE